MPRTPSRLEQTGQVAARYHIVGAHGGAWLYDVGSNEELERLIALCRSTTSPTTPSTLADMPDWDETPRASPTRPRPLGIWLAVVLVTGITDCANPGTRILERQRRGRSDRAGYHTVAQRNLTCAIRIRNAAANSA